MWNPPTKKQLEKIPALYATDSIPAAKKKIHMHFFLGGCDWYVAEYDPSEDLAYGFAIINDDDQMAEWGYISIDELRSIKVGFMQVDRDMHWKPKKAGDVPRIKC